MFEQRLSSSHIRIILISENPFRVEALLYYSAYHLPSGPVAENKGAPKGAPVLSDSTIVPNPSSQK